MLHDAIPGGGVNIYWLLRVSLLLCFVFVTTWLAPTSSIRPLKIADIYEQERSARDPLLGLRAAACLNVFFGHWFLIDFGPSVPAQFDCEYVARVLLSFSPWCGVWMFFTLSGYLMGKGFVTGRHATDMDGLKRFYFNRILRIFPIYFISILFVAVFTNPAAIDLRTQAAWNAVLGSILFDQQNGGIIGALWSVSTEFQFYLLAPFLFLLLAPFASKLKSLALIFILILVALGFIKYFTLSTHPELWHSRVYYPVLINLDCFVCGMITSFAVNHMRCRKFYLSRGLQHGIILAIASQLVFSIWSYHEMISYDGYPGSATRNYYLSSAPAVTTVLICLIIFIFEISKRSNTRIGNIYWRTSTYIGTVTYCLYVFHEPVLRSIRKIYPKNFSLLDSIQSFPFGFILSLGIASIFYYSIEARFDKIRR